MNLKKIDPALTEPLTRVFPKNFVLIYVVQAQDTGEYTAHFIDDEDPCDYGFNVNASSLQGLYDNLMEMRTKMQEHKPEILNAYDRLNAAFHPNEMLDTVLWNPASKELIACFHTGYKVTRRIYAKTASELVDKVAIASQIIATCVECGAQIYKGDEMLPDYPTLYQCPICEHPNGPHDEPHNIDHFNYSMKRIIERVNTSENCNRMMSNVVTDIMHKWKHKRSARKYVRNLCKKWANSWER